MIPKIIHYCWFGHNQLSGLARKCIASWKRYLPDYEIKEWNESNFDVNIISYTKEAYEDKKYAFVSDYARFWILYRYGGIYFDTDVEVIKPLNSIIAKGPFMGCENKAGGAILYVAPGLGIAANPGLGIAANPGMEFYKEMLDLYTTLIFRDHFRENNLKTVVEYTTEVLLMHGLQNINDIQYISGIYIYPKDYFCPKSYETGKISITKNTYTIHHYAQSWKNNIFKLKKEILFVLGPCLSRYLLFINNILKKSFKK